MALGGGSYPDLPLEYQIEPPSCQRCGDGFSDGGFEVNGELVCEDCFREWIDDTYTTEELAEMMGVRVVPFYDIERWFT